MKLTPWFKGKIKPVRKGVYEIALFDLWYGGSRSYSYWNGKKWCGFSTNIKRDLSKDKPNPKHDQSPAWRGILK